VDSLRALLRLIWHLQRARLLREFVPRLLAVTESPAGQQALRTAGERAGVQMRSQARKEVDEAVAAMRKRGLVVNRPNAEQMREWNSLAESLYPRIRGTMVPAETFDEVFTHLKAFRTARGR
jgi:TRAP-type mannitol/chloroaromatic compound transport system substrate-binding protein